MILIRISSSTFFIQNLILAGLGAKNKKFFTTFWPGPMVIYLWQHRSREEIFINNTDLSFSF